MGISDGKSNSEFGHAPLLHDHATFLGIKIHPRWANIDFSDLRGNIRSYFKNPKLNLLHAAGNLIWSDGKTIYRLSHINSESKCINNLLTVSALLQTHPQFPTPAPLIDSVSEIDLGDQGKWLMTAWEVHNFVATPLSKDKNSYHELGILLHVLHSTPMEHLEQYNPLQWAASRISALKNHHRFDELMIQHNKLQEQFKAVFEKDTNVSLHGDIHWEQVVKDTEGKMWLLDFENAAYGHPSVDLIPSAGWIRRSGEPTVSQIRALYEGYGGIPDLTLEQKAVNLAIRDFSLMTWHLLRDQQT